MVTTGFSRVHVAKYAYADGTVTYSDCRELARARSMETDVETTDENTFYANNRVAEIEPAAFSNGTAKINVDGLDPEEEAFILGLAAVKETVGSSEVELVKYGVDMSPPYLGIGAVKRQQLNGVPSYRPVIFTKARFEIPSESAETQEESVSWQDQELNATLLRDDTEGQIWKVIPKTNYTTEADAVSFIRTYLGGMASAEVS